MSANPSVSVLVPVYGVEKHIARCAHSLFGQTYDNIEFIFVNDCTKDASMDILSDVIQLYPERKSSCIIISHEENQGLAAARYTGIKHASGDFIMHVDSDDYLEKEAVSILVNAAINKKADIVIGGSYSDFPDKRVMNDFPSNVEKDELLRNILHLKVAPSIWGKLYSSKLYAPGNDILPLVGVNHGEDFATVPRLIYYAERIAYVDKPLYNYVLYNSNSYTKNFTERSMNSVIVATDKLIDFFHDKLPAETLDMCALRVKLAMFKRMNIELYDRIRSLYPEESGRARRQLALKDKVLLTLIDLRLYRVASLYIRLGLSLLSK